MFSPQESQESQGSQESGCTLKNRFVPSKVIHIVDMKDFVDITGTRKKMDRLNKSKKAREEYLNDIKRNGGDVHLYKVQNFTFRYEREV